MMRGRIIAAPTDFPVRQGWLSVEMAVRALEKRLVLTHAGPPILMVKSDTVDQTPVDGSLALASFVPVCSLEAKEPTKVSPKSRSAQCGRSAFVLRGGAASPKRSLGVVNQAVLMTLNPTVNYIDFQRGTPTRWHLVTNDGAGAPTLTDMGASFTITTGGGCVKTHLRPPLGGTTFRCLGLVTRSFWVRCRMARLAGSYSW
jgi:hypothetical protein